MSATDRRQTWTEAMDAVLSRLWAEGHVASAIGREMGRSKNAIVGRSHRLHLPPRPSPIPGHVPALPKPTVPKPLPPPVIVAPVPLPTPPRLPGVRACQYPFGHPKERGFRFCGAAVDGGVYCREHMALCYGTRRDLAA